MNPDPNAPRPICELHDEPMLLSTEPPGLTYWKCRLCSIAFREYVKSWED